MKKLITGTMLATLFAALTTTAQAGINIDCFNVVQTVPDPGATSVLMGIALAGLAFVKRVVR